MKKSEQTVYWIKLTLIFIFLLHSGRMLASAQLKPPTKDRGIFTFTLENDVWLYLDDGYTNGLKFGWISPQLEGGKHPGFLSFMYRLNHGLLRGKHKGKDQLSGEQRFFAFSLHQGIFTPEDLSRADFSPDDRPYAGLLAVNTHLVRITINTQDVFGLTAGIVGPHSLAEKAQTWLHETYDWARPRGWKNQLKDEPVLNLWFGRTWLFYRGNDENDGFQYGAKTGVNAQLGNLVTSAGGLLELGLGWNFRPELEVCSPAPFFGDLSLGRVKKFSIFGYVRAEGRVVARNLLLQGNTFVSSPGVKINHLYGQITTGLGYRNAFSSARFYLVLRSKEFLGQKYYDPYVGLTVDLNL